MLIEYKISVTGGVATVTQRIEPGKRTVKPPVGAEKTTTDSTELPAGTTRQLNSPSPSPQAGDEARPGPNAETPPSVSREPTTNTTERPPEREVPPRRRPATTPSGLVIAFGPVVFFGSSRDDGGGPVDRTDTD